MACSLSSAKSAGVSRANSPACTAGWSVLTRPPRSSGTPVTCSGGRRGRPASRRTAAVPPVETSSTPTARRAWASGIRPVLSAALSSARRIGLMVASCALYGDGVCGTGSGLTDRMGCRERRMQHDGPVAYLDPAVGPPANHLGVEPAFLDLDPRREAFERVALEHRHRGLRHDRTAIRSIVHEMYCTPAHGDAGVEHRLVHPLPVHPLAAEGRQQRRVCIQDTVTVTGYERGREDA